MPQFEASTTLINDTYKYIANSNKNVSIGVQGLAAGAAVV